MEPLKDGDPGKVGRFRLLGRLGRGGMGQVFLGETPGGKKVAVKLIRPEYADDPEFRVRFAREVEAARRVGGFHTALVVDADPNADPPWMVTEYVAGQSLLAAVEEDGPLSPSDVNALGAALAEGLAAIHKCELIHRDLKPGNVILAADGPRIIDFGIAKSTGAASITLTGVAVGSVQYMSPEQLGTGRIGYESDIFSLGSLLTFAATGRGPFDATLNSIVMARILTQPPDLGGLEGPLRDIITACLTKDPAGRPDPDTLLAYFAGTRQPLVEPVAAPDRSASKVPHPEPRATDTDGDATLRRSLVSEGHRLEVHDAEVRHVSFSPDGRFLATGAADWSLCVWDVSTWRPVAAPSFCKRGNFPVRGFRQLVFTPDSRTVLAAREGDSMVWRLDAGTGNLAARPIAGPGSAGTAHGSPHTQVLSADGKYGLCYTGVSLILSDMVADKSVMLRMYPHALGVVFGEASFAVGGDLVGVVDSSHRIHLWNRSTTAWAGRLDPPPGLEDSPSYQVRQVILSAEMAAAICDVGDARNGRALYQWNLRDGRPSRPRVLDYGRDGRLVRMALAPDGQTLATITRRGDSLGDSGDVMVSLWDMHDGKRTDLPEGCHEVPRLIFSPDGRLLVTMVASMMRLWDLRGDGPVSLGSKTSRFGDPLNDGAWSPNGRTLVTAEGRAARVWQRPRN